MVKNRFECESCGRILSKKDGKETWKSSEGREICGDCMFEPLNILSKVFYCKTFKEAKELIRGFDEECEASFLGVEYV